MSKVCEICGKHPSAGRSYARRGLAKKKGGVGRKITGVAKRRFVPNIQIVRIKDDKGSVRRARICAKCLRNGVRKGTITKATRKPRPSKKAPEPVFQAAVSPLEREPSAGPAPRAGGEISDRLAEEIEEAYEEEKAAERESEMPPDRASGPHRERPGVTGPEAPPEDAPEPPSEEPEAGPG